MCVCVCFFKKKLTTVLHRCVEETLLSCHTALTRGRDVAEMPQCTDTWERRDHLHKRVGEKSESLLSGGPRVFHSL